MTVKEQVKALRAQAAQWVAASHSAADEGHMMDAVQHLRRANECVLTARQLEQTLAD